MTDLTKRLRERGTLRSDQLEAADEIEHLTLDLHTERAAVVALRAEVAGMKRYRFDEALKYEALLAEVAGLREDARRYRWLASHCRSTPEHWGGRWSIVIEGPVPKTQNSEDDFDAAIDAARKAAL